MKRMAFLRRLRELIAVYGSANVVYFDESGFKKHSYRMHGWALHGEKIYGDVSGNNCKSTNLIMAQRGKKWLAPETFKEACNAARVNEWLENKLQPYRKQLRRPQAKKRVRTAGYRHHRSYKNVRLLFGMTIESSRSSLRESPFMSSRRSVEGSTPMEPGDLRPSFPFNDHAAGIIKLVRREFRRTTHMPPAPLRRRHARFRPLRNHAALEFGDCADHRKHMRPAAVSRLCRGELLPDKRAAWASGDFAAAMRRENRMRAFASRDGKLGSLRDAEAIIHGERHNTRRGHFMTLSGTSQ